MRIAYVCERIFGASPAREVKAGNMVGACAQASEQIARILKSGGRRFAFSSRVASPMAREADFCPR
ncbi:MAG: hypothetical protein DBX55_01500 [Verrucomicrobia bacterium]|nr:MAG: hypothetical protein DBX55_01500 [Verrucomicrobiota bacterium]